MDFTKTTEQSSLYDNLQHANALQILTWINQEDQKVAIAVEKAIPQINVVVQKIVEIIQQGGRLFYIGAGTSGRLGVLDASECPPTFGVDPQMVIGIIAGGDTALRYAVENAEDNMEQGFLDLQEFKITSKDFVIGIAASGTTPYVLNAVKRCQENQIQTACITCNLGSPLAKIVEFPIEVVVGPEFITASSRMKAGSAQKMVLNMISTSVMVLLGKVQGNSMVDMKMTNNKLRERGISILMQELDISYKKANQLLNQYKNVRQALTGYKNK
ncbi:N-acetylmuramic acid 6-phosphate etherase [Myroides sp. LJL119]